MQSYEQMMYLLQPMLQGTQSVWVQAVYLAGMFAALLWKTRSVENWSLFRYSFLFYAASLIVPQIVNPFMMSLLMENGRGFPAAGGLGQVTAQIVSQSLWPVLFSLAVIFGMTSMMPRTLIPYNPAAKPQQPVPHPLD